jgi:hypothetical protein
MYSTRPFTTTWSRIAIAYAKLEAAVSALMDNRTNGNVSHRTLALPPLY